MTTIVTRTGKGSPLTHVEVDTNFTNLNTAKLETLVAAAGAGSAAAPSISFTGDTNTGLFSPGADTLAFAEGGVEAMRIDSSGRVGIGVVPAGYGENSRLTLDSTGLTNAIYSNFNGTGNDTHIFLTNGGSALCYLGTDNTSLTFGVGNTERARIDSSGRLLVGTSSANANGGILQLTSGITFPATAVAASNANTLDDYEEGTWTPALVGTTAVSYSNQVGKYVKIGKMVHVQAMLQTASQTFSNTASSLQISGLPFLPNDNTGYLGTHGSVSAQELNFDAASNTQSANGDYITTSIVSSNIGFGIITKGTTRGEIRNLGFGASGTGACIVEFELTYYTTS
jgi:hypothetical protein